MIRGVQLVCLNHADSLLALQCLNLLARGTGEGQVLFRHHVLLSREAAPDYGRILSLAQSKKPRSIAG
jgi:hypothetical protein